MDLGIRAEGANSYSQVLLCNSIIHLLCGRDSQIWTTLNVTVEIEASLDLDIYSHL